MAADKKIMAELETLRRDRPGRILAAAYEVLPHGLVAALRELAATYREEADLWSRSGAKGWKGNEAEALMIGDAVTVLADQLESTPTPPPAPAREPVGQTEPATTHERLVDLVNSAAAEGRGLLRDADQPIPAQDITGADVGAYLSGATDTLPGLADALVPGSVTDATVTVSPGGVAHLPGVTLTGNGDGTMSNVGPMTLEIPTMPPSWESDTMTADGHRPPGLTPTPAAPPLGQPGDMGAGYRHDYIPPGGRRVTFAELLTPVPVAALPPHVSNSQIDTVGNCAAKYRMQRVDQLPQIPQWANIGGTTFHAAVESWERMAAQYPGISLNEEDVEGAWKHHFESEINRIQATTTVPISSWRAARKGAEGRQWWEVNGPLMLRRYLDARPAEPTSNLPAMVASENGSPFQLAIELDLTVDVPTPYGPIPFNAKLDRVTNAAQPGPDSPESNWITLVIRDYKTSYERPTDTTQLGDYAWTLRLWGVPESVRILGTFFDARRGEWTEPVDLLQAHPFESFQYRVTGAHAQKRALTTGPTPARPSSYCGGCSVRYACPIMATRS